MSQTNVGSGSALAVTVQAKAKNKGGRPRKHPLPEVKIEPPREGRRYGPETDSEEDSPGFRGVNVVAMNESQLRQFAMQNFGRRFQENETREYMLRDIQGRMDVGRNARYA